MIAALACLGAALGIAGAWLVAAVDRRPRWWGFACFLASNVCWIAWGLVTAGGWPLVAMQLAFCVTSARGLWMCRRRVAAVYLHDTAGLAQRVYSQGTPTSGFKREAVPSDREGQLRAKALVS